VTGLAGAPNVQTKYCKSKGNDIRKGQSRSSYRRCQAEADTRLPGRPAPLAMDTIDMTFDPAPARRTFPDLTNTGIPTALKELLALPDT